MNDFTFTRLIMLIPYLISYLYVIIQELKCIIPKERFTKDAVVKVYHYSYAYCLLYLILHVIIYFPFIISGQLNLGEETLIE